MSHLRIPRKQSHSPRNKIHSQQSKPLKYSAQRIIHESILKRRTTTQNNSLQKFEADNSKEYHHRSKQKHKYSTLTLNSTVRNQIEQAKKAFKTKNTKKALPLFKKVYEKYPALPDIPYFIGSCLLNEGKLGAALTYFNTTLQLDSNYDKNVYIYIAICYKSMGKIGQAAETLNQAVQKYPRFEQAHFYKAKMHIRLNQYYQSINSLKKCVIINNKNQLAFILLGDSLKKVGRMKQCLQKYEKAILLKGQHTKVACVHKLNALVQVNNTEELQKAIHNFKEKQISQPEFNYFEAIVLFNRNKIIQSSILFQIAMKQNLGTEYLSNIIKYLIKISIISKDFFGAEHLIARARLLEISDQQILLFFDLVQGINDLIKRKIIQGEKKLTKVYKECKTTPKYQFLHETVLPYYGYCLFQQDHITQALNSFKQYLILPIQYEKKQIQLYNGNICEGILFHKNKNFAKAQEKFEEALVIFPDKIEPIFFICINDIQIMKSNSQSQQHSLEKINTYFGKSSKIVPQNSLFLFYQSLVYLYQNKDACSVIKQAIKTADEEVSEYFFIEALAHCLRGQVLRGLNSINKAIEIDQNIPQFFKERSKYFYLLERYDQSVEDIMRVLMENSDDQEAKLLLTFYYYLTGSYEYSLQLLRQLTHNTTKSDQSSENKFLEFQQALNFRLKNYNQCGIVGKVINSIIRKTQLQNQQINEFHELINSKSSYSEFNLYILFLIYAAYFLYVEFQPGKEGQRNLARFDEAVDCLFGALEQVNFHAENKSENSMNQKEQFSPAIQRMLSEVKFNIVVANLLRAAYQQYNQQGKDILKQTIKFIKIFISQTQDLEFIQLMRKLLEFLTTQSEHPSQLTLELQKKVKKTSDQFPEMTIKVLNKTIKTKFMIYYPQKLKFNITPQFDESFLYNFGIDKIEAKLCPPWYRIENMNGGLVFTDKVRNQSIMISETQKSNTPLLRAATPIEVSIRDKFKLDESVERKLNKLMQRK